jgi:hypothetical protein
VKRAAALRLVATLLLPSPALAQAGDSVHATDPGRRPALIGVAATLAPIAAGAITMAATDADGIGLLVMYGGAILGPSIGNWSAGLVSRGFTGLAIRTGLGVVATMGPFVVCPGLDECSDGAFTAAGVLFVGANALLLAHASWDLATLPKRARAQAARVSVAPTWVPATRAPGLAMRVEF